MFTGGNMIVTTRTQNVQGVFAYPEAAVYDFVAANNMDQHNATHLIWHGSNPAWFTALTTAAPLRAALNTHIPTVMQRFPLMKSWNVVNEVIATWDNQPGSWRNTSIYQALGANFPSEWFKLARTVAPTTELAWTDNWAIEAKTPESFDAVKAALIWALNDGAPIDTFGVQMHHNRLDNASAAQMVDRLGQLAALGLTLRITEADVTDRDGHWPLATRRRDQVAYVEDIIGSILAQVPEVVSYNMWTVGDADCWLDIPAFGGTRTDGLKGEFSAIGRDGIVKPEWWAMFERITRP